MAETPQDQAQPQNAQPELTNTLFPPPPAHYKAFTSANIARHAALAGPSGTSKNRGDASDSAPEAQTGPGEEEAKEFKLLSAGLQPPRVDWVLEEGRWKCFGETYTVSCLSARVDFPGLKYCGLS